LEKDQATNTLRGSLVVVLSIVFFCTPFIVSKQVPFLYQRWYGRTSVATNPKHGDATTLESSLKQLHEDSASLIERLNLADRIGGGLIGGGLPGASDHLLIETLQERNLTQRHALEDAKSTLNRIVEESNRTQEAMKSYIDHLNQEIDDLKEDEAKRKSAESFKLHVHLGMMLVLTLLGAFTLIFWQKGFLKQLPDWSKEVVKASIAATMAGWLA
jgi:hypothetical protein